MLFSLDNLPYWILLGVGLLLFMVVIVSGAGEEGLEVEGDADLDVDLDADLDADLESGADLDLDGDGGVGLQILGWLGVGRAPLVLLLAMDFSLWGLLGWMATVLLGEIGIASAAGIWAGGIMAGSLVLSLTTGGLAARPIGRIFAGFTEETRGERLIGRVGSVSSATVPQDGSIGQVDVFDGAQNLVTISALSPPWATEIPQRGQEVMVIDHQPQGYVVILRSGADEQRWLGARSPRSQSSG